MPFIGHGSYMHAASKTVIHVNEWLTDVGSGGGGKLYYESVDLHYQGYLKYAVRENALEVTTMMADPQRQKLGSLLLWIAGAVADRWDCGWMEAVTVAPTAHSFYRLCGFAPIDQGVSHSNWRGGRDAVRERTHGQFGLIWIPLNGVTA
jgi:GNAT superfamily N-acetyltransferase